MRILATFKIALRALRRNKLRTLLTMLGMIIGVGAVIAMISFGNGAKAQVEAQIASLGQNVILIFAGNMSRGGVSGGFGSMSTLTVDDAEAIRREVPGVAGVSPEVRTQARQIAVGNQNWSTQILGVSPDYAEIRQWRFEEGGMFGELEVRNAAKVAVIGSTVARQLFPEGNPVGQILRISIENASSPFVVVGLLAPKGTSLMGSDQDDIVLVPFTSAMKRLSRVNYLRSVSVQASSKEMVPHVQSEIAELLRQRHQIAPGREDDFTIRTQQEIAETANEASRVMRILLAGIASVSLVVGGIGIMNIMLVSVTERTREIGIRMAVGARGRDILLQFLIEAITLSVIGGALGIGAGVGVAKLITAWPSEVSTTSIGIAFVFSAVIGIFFGFYPARQAAQLDPIDALRYE